jgi:hypothetical protein
MSASYATALRTDPALPQQSCAAAEPHVHVCIALPGGARAVGPLASAWYRRSDANPEALAPPLNSVCSSVSVADSSQGAARAQGRGRADAACARGGRCGGAHHRERAREWRRGGGAQARAERDGRRCGVGGGASCGLARRTSHRPADHVHTSVVQRGCTATRPQPAWLTGLGSHHTDARHWRAGRRYDRQPNLSPCPMRQPSLAPCPMRSL